jgi:hypothetical protein
VTPVPLVEAPDAPTPPALLLSTPTTPAKPLWEVIPQQAVLDGGGDRRPEIIRESMEELRGVLAARAPV